MKIVNALAVALVRISLAISITAVQAPAAATPTFAEQLLQGKNYRVVLLGDHGKNGEVTIMAQGDDVVIDWRNLLLQERTTWTVNKDGELLRCESYRFDNGLKTTRVEFGKLVGGKEMFASDKDSTHDEPLYGIGNPIPYQIIGLGKGGKHFQREQRRVDQFVHTFLQK